MLTQTAPSRNTAGYLARLQALDRASPQRDRSLVADHLASHRSDPMRDWLADHPRSTHAFIPVGVAWLNRSEVWWRLFRRKAFAGQSLADHHDIAYVTHLATAQLNRHATPSPGSGDVHPDHSASFVAASCTLFEERCIMNKLSAKITGFRVDNR